MFQKKKTRSPVVRGRQKERIKFPILPSSSSLSRLRRERAPRKYVAGGRAPSSVARAEEEGRNKIDGRTDGGATDDP